MKYVASSALLLISLLLGSGHAQTSMDNPPPDPYKAPIDSWGQLPDGRKWGAVVGLSSDSKGHLWVVERCGGNTCAGSDVPPIVELDATGKTLKTFGGSVFVIPHAIFVDKKDKDNVWAVDQGQEKGKGEQVWKFSPDGKVLMTLGKPGEKGDSPDTFNDPTGVVIGKNGDIFVSDGHSGRGQTIARVVKFSKDGKFIKAWGKKGSEPGDLDDPHAITMDSEGRLFVADRNNFRVSIFDQDGNFLGAWKQFGIPTGIFIDGKDFLYVAQNYLRPQDPDYKRGIRIGSAKDGKLTGYIEDPDQDPKDGVIGPESLYVDKAGTIYNGDDVRQMIKKFVLR